MPPFKPSRITTITKNLDKFKLLSLWQVFHPKKPIVWTTSFHLDKVFTFDHTLPTAISILFPLFYLPFGWHLYEIHRDLPLAGLSFFFSFNTLIRVLRIEMRVPLSSDPLPQDTVLPLHSNASTLEGNGGGGGTHLPPTPTPHTLLLFPQSLVHPPNVNICSQ